MRSGIVLLSITIVFLLLLSIVISVDSNIYFFSDSQMIRAADGSILTLFLSEDEQYVLPFNFIEDYPESFIRCVLLKEDKRFFYHLGIDPLSVLRAIYGNISGKKRSGASTITMQLARMRGNRERTYINKIIEMIEALKIELSHSKDEILKAYLDQAPYGMNIRGAATASQMFFSKHISKLTWAEYATLSVLPNNPSYVNVNMHRERLRAKRDIVLERLFEKGLISKQDMELSKTEKIPHFEKKLPFFASHLCMSIKNENKDSIVDTTIDFSLQKKAESITTSELKGLKQNGINNLSVIIIDNEKMEILAYVGNPVYFDKKNHSMVDGVIASRSTGSILKPFLYALAIDQGLIIPDSLMLDIPTFYGSYSPENFDNAFRGAITARQALISSLNIPAIRLLKRYSVNAFYDFLKKAGMTTLFRDADDYGLSLITGGAEGNLLEITQMFAALANKGKFLKSKVTKDEKKNEHQVLISQGACFSVLDCLKGLRRPGIDGIYREFESSKEIAWKTGTSYGSRDAWSVGTDGRYTVGVWAGNFNGVSSPYLTGAQTAAPVMFRLFSLGFFKDSKFYHSDEDIANIFSKIKVCKTTGYRATEECSETKYIDVPKKSKLLTPCPYHVKVPYDKRINRVVCSGCWDVNGYELKSFLWFPPQAVPYLSENLKKGLIPPHKEDCNEISKIDTIKIIYPTNGSILSHQKGEKILVELSKNKGSHECFIFLNKRLFNNKDKERFFISPDKGENNIEIISEDGSIDRVKFFVE